jgi:5'-nucleotidase
MIKKMRILISNDDGIYSPGIIASRKSRRVSASLRIVAPDVEQSSMGHAITSHARFGTNEFAWATSRPIE